MKASRSTVMGRLVVCFLVLMGQLIASGCAVLLLICFRIVSQAIPVLRSPVWAMLFLSLAYLALPILFSYALVKGFSAQSKPIVVSVCSCLAAAFVFITASRFIGGNRHVALAATGPLLVLLLIASVGGSYLAMYILPGAHEGAG